jgi:ribosome biogenesis GTPase / thiamine phosphate phosphatase
MSPASALAGWGWDDGHANAFASQASTGHEAGRILVEDRGSYLVGTAAGDVRATVSGRFRFDAELDGPAGFPVVGDWVILQPTGDPDHRLVQGLLPRRTAVIRRAPADRSAADQVLAANVDVLLIVTSLNHDLNPRRLERYLALAWSSGAEPILVLNKADLATDVDAEVARVEALAGGVPVLAVSAATGQGLDVLASRLVDGRTVALIGSSGVGKSTLVNALAGEVVEATAEIREDDGRGRHTTSRRHLVRVPGRGLILDTPGMRELGLADADGGLDATFADIDALAAGCRFGDCSHEREPGCAVRQAIAEGSLDPARLASRRKLDRETARVERQNDPRARAERKRQNRLLHSAVNHHMRMKYGEERW